MNPVVTMNYSPIKKVESLKDVPAAFHPNQILNPDSEFYVERDDLQLKLLFKRLVNAPSNMHAFLCGHRGSGKTTELLRICRNREINEKYHTVYLTAQEFGSDTVHLTHDAILVEIGRSFIDEKNAPCIDDRLVKMFDDWGAKVTSTFIHDASIKQEIGAKPNLWVAFYKGILASRKEWKIEEKRSFEPQVQNLVSILNLMAQEIRNNTCKKLLVIVDDLEKGDSDAHRKMHERIFQDNFDTLVQPNFSIIYTLPVYFRGLESSRIPADHLYAFSAVRLYEQKYKGMDKPPLNHDSEGYRLMRSFIEKRIVDFSNIFESEEVFEEILRIGGGLFRETERAMTDAAFIADLYDSEKIDLKTVEKVFNEVKKEYQPAIRGSAVKILKEVLRKPNGWVPGIEPFLQSKAVVEYENGDLWLDLRHVLKPYVKGLADE